MRTSEGKPLLLPPAPQAGAALCGVGAAVVLGPAATVVVGGASAGAALGILGHVATAPKAEKEPNKMVKEL